MRGPIARAAAVGLSALTLAACASPPRPPVVEAGARPRWGDALGTWTARTETPVYADAGDRDHVAFSLRPRERFEALDGRLHTVAYGHIRFFRGGEVYRPGSDRPIRLWPLEEVVLTTRASEDTWRAWVRGAPHEFVMSACDDGWHTELVPPSQEWWVQVRDTRGRTGWVLVPPPEPGAPGGTAG